MELSETKEEQIFRSKAPTKPTQPTDSTLKPFLAKLKLLTVKLKTAHI
jgi:hypothetical protein